MKEVFIGFYFSLLFFVAVYGTHLYWLIFLYLKNRRRRLLVPAGKLGRSDFPMVTVQLPLYNERRVAVRIIKAVAAFDWPRHKLEIQVLDDSTDVTSQIIATFLKARKQNGLTISHIRRRDRRGFKAGALSDGLKSARGDYIAIFDADNLPRPDFLKRTVPHFNDASVGMVQTRWGFLNRGESLLCGAQALQLDSHFIIEQQARFRGELLFNFNGTAGIWRRRAIIEAGGWQHDTLTEDLDLSFRSQMAGWKFVFDSDYVVPTELPNSIGGFKTQQYRWAKGAVQTFFKLAPRIVRSSLPARVKLASLLHLSNKFVSLALLTLGLLLIPALYFRLEAGLTKLLLIDFPIFIAGTGSMSLFYSLAYKAGRPEKKSTDIVTLPMLTSIGIGLAINNSRALLSAILRRRSPFRRTPKSGSIDGGFRKIPTAYIDRIDSTTYLETAMTFYSLTALFLALHLKLYFTLPFMATFFMGYLYFSFRGWSEAYAQQRIAM